MEHVYILPIGTILTGGQNSYHVEEVLGQGGYGITYKVWAVTKDGQIPVKVPFAIKEHFVNGRCHRAADGVTVEYSQEAAEDKGVAYAQCKLGDRYMTGSGVEQNTTKAALLYLDAEAQNHLTPQSAKNLAECYKQKLAVLPDLQNADKRMEQLNKQKANGNLISLLRVLEN